MYTGKKRSIILRRPLQRLYPLEINAPPETSSEDPSEPESCSTAVEPEAMPAVQGPVEELSSRPKRSAAVRAQDRILAQRFY